MGSAVASSSSSGHGAAAVAASFVVYEGGMNQGKNHREWNGMWVNNAMEGRGIAVYPSGQRYEGMWVGGKREKRGTIIFNNGAVYKGRG